MTEDITALEHGVWERNLVIEILRDQVRYFTMNDGTILNSGLACKSVMDQLEALNDQAYTQICHIRKGDIK